MVDPKAREARLIALKQGNPVSDFEVDVTTKSGEVRSGLATVATITLGGEAFAMTTFIDITERKRVEHQLTQMKRLYATLSQVNQIIVRVREHSELYQSICNVAVEFGKFSLAWVGLLDKASGEIRPVAATGLDVAHWPFPIVNIDKKNGKDGLAAAAIRTAKVVTSENIQTDERTRKQRDQLRSFDFHSSAVVPFRLHGEIIGIVGLVSDEEDLFKVEEEIHLLNEMGMDISFALDKMAAEAAHKQAEQQLIKSEEQFRTAFDNMLEGTQILGFDWRYRYLNRSAEVHNRRPSKELLGNIYMDMWPGIQDTYVFAVIKRCMEEHIPCEIQNEFIYPDGGVGWFELEIQPIPEGVLILSLDITERKRAEAMRNQLANIVAASEDAILSTTLDGIITSWNNGAERLYQYSAAEAIGKSISSIIPADRPNELSNILRRIQRGEHIKHYETVRLRKDGTEVDVSITISPMLDDVGMIIGVSAIARDISERKWAEEKIHTQIQHLNSLREIDTAILSSFGMKIGLDAVVSRTIIELNIDAADIQVLNADFGLLEYRSGWGFDTKAIQNHPLKMGEGVAGRCIQERKPIHIRDLREGLGEEFVRKDLLVREKFVGYYCVPLIDNMEVKGVLEIFHRAPLEPPQDWIDFLYTLAGQAALAIQSASLFSGLQRSNKELTQAYDATIVGWSRAMDLRDKETAGHTQRVTELTVELAQTLGMSDKQLIHIRRGALLHDMGKLGVPDDVLLKPGKLTDEEWVAMRKHPQYAYDMFSSIDYLRPALDIPYCHHEKWDGTGYPRRLAGEQIPLAARLFAVVDVWDALRSDRPYRPSWPEEKVLAYIREQSGTHFDPQAVKLFLQVIGEKNYLSE